MAEICLATKTWRSGAAWHLHELARALAEAGATVTLIAPLAEPSSREARHRNIRRVVPPRERVGGAGNRLSRPLASLSRIAAGSLAVLSERTRSRTFLVTIPDPLLFTLPLFALLRLTGGRVLFLVHDAEPHAWRLPPPLRWVERGAHRLSYRLANDLIVLTPAVRESLADRFALRRDKVTIIPHGPLTVPNVPPLPGEGRLLLFGTMRRNKCVLEVIQAVRLVRRRDPAVRLLLAGEPHPQEGDYWAACEAAIAEEPEPFEVRRGYLPDDELPALMARADAFVLAYRDFHSASGVAVLAALAGRPVIATRSGSLGELFDAGMAGETIAEPVTPESVAAGIVAFRARSADDWRTSARTGTERVGRLASWESIAAAHLQLIRSGTAGTMPAAAIGRRAP